MDKETKNEFQSLAHMIKKGFDHIDGQLEQVDGQLEQASKERKELEQGQEDIKLCLDNVAYKFELQELEERVKRLELKTNLSKN